MQAAEASSFLVGFGWGLEFAFFYDKHCHSTLRFLRIAIEREREREPLSIFDAPAAYAVVAFDFFFHCVWFRRRMLKPLISAYRRCINLAASPKAPGAVDTHLQQIDQYSSLRSPGGDSMLLLASSCNLRMAPLPVTVWFRQRHKPISRVSPGSAHFLMRDVGLHLFFSVWRVRLPVPYPPGEGSFCIRSGV